MRRPDQTRLGRRVKAELAERLSPERTREATFLERMTVERLDWRHIVRLNRYLELFGRLATAIWVMFLVSLVVGVDPKEVVEDTVNSGEPVKGAFVLAIVLPTLLFLVARSMIGFARWRLQRELWRRDVDRLGATADGTGD